MVPSLKVREIQDMRNRVHHYITDIIFRWSIKFQNQIKPKQQNTTNKSTRRSITALPSIFLWMPLHQKNKWEKLRPLVKEEEEMAWICSFHLKVPVNLESWRFQLSGHFASLWLTGFALPKLPLLPLRAIIRGFSLAKLSNPTCLSQRRREKKRTVHTISQSEPY